MMNPVEGTGVMPYISRCAVCEAPSQVHNLPISSHPLHYTLSTGDGNTQPSRKHPIMSRRLDFSLDRVLLRNGL